MLRNRQDVLNKLQLVGSSNCHISEITYAELLYGLRCSSRVKENLKALNAFIKGIDVLPISNVLEKYADIKYLLRKTGKMVDDADIFIGATAIAHKMVMVTDNTRHLENMPGIIIDNWVNKTR